jgi:hypothetical protein
MKHMEMWIIFLGFTVWGMVAGIIIGAWIMQRHSVVVQAESFIEEVTN